MFMPMLTAMVKDKKFSDFLVYTGGYKSLENFLGENIPFEKLDYCNIAAVFVFVVVSFYLFVRMKGDLIFKRLSIGYFKDLSTDRLYVKH